MRSSTWLAPLHAPAIMAALTILLASAFLAPLRSAEDLASRARITADSEYSPDYRARFVADGEVPAAKAGGDVRRAWAVRGETHRDGATLTLEWKQPVEVAEVVYYGRTAFYIEECWKGYEVRADDAPAPLLRGELAMRHGPQRIRLPRPVTTRRLRIVFTSSWGGPNPGASEVRVFSRSPSDRELARLDAAAETTRARRDMPWLDRVDPPALTRLIARLEAEHGTEAVRAVERRRELDRLGREIRRPEGADAPDAARIEEVREALGELQREILLTGVEEIVVIRRHEIVASHVYTYHYEGFRPGSELLAVRPCEPGREPRVLVSSPEGQILDCDLSWDGSTILFSWRQRESEGYHLWTIAVDGSGLHRITDGRWHDYNGCWLPDGGIAFLSTRSPQFAYCWHAPVGVVHRMDPDGGNVRRLSANYLNDFTPYPLPDGRIIYSRWEYVDKPAIPIQSLWTIRPDGTGLSVYFGNRVLSPGTFMEARAVPGSQKILCTMTGHNGPTRGAIGLIDPAQGVNAQEAIVNLTPDVPVPKVDQGNGNTSGTKQYSGPCPLDSTRFLVSARGPLLVRDIEGTCQSIVLPPPPGGMQYLGAVPVRARKRPPVLPPAAPAAHGGSPGETALVYLQDVYAGLEPHVRRGDVARVRVVREMPKTVRIDPSYRAFGFQFPVISCGATYAGKDVLGEVPVERDGSAYFRVPAGVPIYFMVLDARGRALQRMRSFTHLMPGETQGCIGCHEPRRTAPHLRGSVAPGREPRELEPPEWGRGGFDYSRIVQPVLDRHCVRCHDAVRAPKGLDLSGAKTDYFSVSYDTLAREGQGPQGSRWVRWIPTYNGQEQNILEVTPLAWGSPRSRLAEVILSGHPDAEGEARVALDDRDRRRILAWIDLNVPYYGSSETAYPEAPGCRRLYPKDLDRVLGDVGRRRCASCHEGGKVPRREWTRITEPEGNPFLVAPLARAAGGSERCGQAVFASREDPDYQAILATFRPIREQLAERPRIDMEGGQPAPDVCRDCQ